MANLVGVLWFKALEKASSLLVVGGDQGVVTIDVVFKFHSQVTFLFLLLSSGILQVAEFSGKPIQCHQEKLHEALIKVASTSCWLNTTSVSTDPVDWGPEGNRGVARLDCPDGGDCKFNLAYYQWTPWVLLALAFLFYIPRWAWGLVEQGYLKTVLLTYRSFEDPTEPKSREAIRSLNKDILERKNFWNGVSIVHLLGDVVNFVLVIGVYLFLDFYFGTFTFKSGSSSSVSYLSLGFKQMYFWNSGTWSNEHMRLSPGQFLFPRLSSCDFTMGGSGGRDRVYNLACFLYLNNINEKIFILLWFWLSILCILGAITIFARVMRASVFASYWKVNASRIVCRRTASDSVDLEEPCYIRNLTKMAPKIPPGVFFIMNLVKLNSSEVVYREVLLQMLEIIKETEGKTQ